ncbi:MAG TPA: hypothetical protein VES95_12045 [Dermatophilaceae bacterium]|nr:hypothetical protein [Dermatophilaceae bacterium]
MLAIDDLRNNVDLTPIYAAVGVTDLAVEKAREAREQATKMSVEVRADLEPATVQRRAANVVDQAMEIPATALNGSLTAAGKVAEGYEALAERGEHLVERIRTQRATQELVHQAESTVARSKGAVTTARKAATEVERSAKATITTGRKEAAHVVDTLSEEARVAGSEVKESAKRTRSAARRTNTTAKNATKRTQSSSKGAVTSARKTTKATTKATKKAAEEVGA